MPLIELGVHDFLALTLKRGGPGVVALPGRAAAGNAAHRLLAAQRPAAYQREVGIVHLFTWGDYRLRVRGRIDGVLPQAGLPDGQAGGLLVEEIKSTYLPLEMIRLEDYPIHVAQLQLYHHFMCARHPDQHIAAALTYVQASTGEARTFSFDWEAEESQHLFEYLAMALLRAEEEARHWRALRNASIATLRFPFPDLREGQAALMQAVEAAIGRRHDLLLEAATGIGKTMGALFPALRGLAAPNGYVRIFYLTAKTSGAEVVRHALELLRAQGLRLRTLYLTAKEKMCPYAGADWPGCDAAECPCAADFYPRAARVLPALLLHDTWAADAIQAVAAQETLCPFELSLELSLYADLIVGDYNYVFDPGAALRRFFRAGTPPANLFIVDEAHNLVGRARETYSALLEETTLRALLAGLPDATLAACAEPLLARFAAWRDDLAFEGAKALPLPELPADVGEELDGLLEMLGEILLRMPRGTARTALLSRFFDLLHCGRIAAEFGADDAAYIQRAGKAAAKLRLFCPHPGAQLRQRLQHSLAAIFISATLSPPDYYRELLGAREGAASLSLPSPFPPEQRLYLHVPDVSTRFTKREETRPSVAQVILTTVRARAGNYLAFFPSYAYLSAVWAEIMLAQPRDLTVFAQKPNMHRDAQVAFLREVCAPDGEAKLGLAVMGGLFGEAVDLPGEQLIGVIIIGPGLPSVNPEQELIRAYFDERDGDGFYHAYIVPGMTRVIQAAGRVFRTPQDRGVVVLIDDRFLEEPYRWLLPEDWDARAADFSAVDYAERLREFWQGAALRAPDGV